MAKNIQLTITITPRTVLLLLLLGLVIVVPFELGSETITMTTTYPSPAGIYAKLISTADTSLARNVGKLGVGMGTTIPGSLLSVNGNVAVGSYAANAAPSNGLIVSGNVGIGNLTPQAALDVQSTNSGVVVPRLTTSQINAIVGAPAGSIVYDKSLFEFKGYMGATPSWQAIAATGGTPGPGAYNAYVCQGIYTLYGAKCESANPCTGGCSCPSGLKAHFFHGTGDQHSFQCTPS